MNPENEQKSDQKKNDHFKNGKDVVETNSLILFSGNFGSVGWGPVASWGCDIPFFVTTGLMATKKRSGWWMVNVCMVIALMDLLTIDGFVILMVYTPRKSTCRVKS